MNLMKFLPTWVSVLAVSVYALFAGLEWASLPPDPISFFKPGPRLHRDGPPSNSYPTRSLSASCGNGDHIDVGTCLAEHGFRKSLNGDAGNPLTTWEYRFWGLSPTHAVSAPERARLDDVIVIRRYDLAI